MAKIQFATAYNLPEKKEATASGSRKKNVYNYRINNHGSKVLEKTGEEDLQDMINSFEEETKIENILARAKLGDRTAIRENIDFGDLTSIPNNIIEAKRQILTMENYWKTLPMDIKAKYGNNMDKFMNDVGSEQWLKNMGLAPQQTTVVDNSKSTPTEETPQESS